jgi:HAE1 family hydrophobic/amphiphilic exporter-1
VVTVSAGLKGFDLGGSAEAVTRAVSDLDLPESLTWQVSGQSSEMQASLTSLWSALALAIFLVYVVMASTFEHLLHPLVILVSIPLALVGAVLALVVVGTPVSVVVLLGSIVLVGVVVNNAIVLVDTIGRERSHTPELDEAICRSGRLRLRPILITTCTTVVGLLPLTLGLGAGAEIQGPLALTVVGGLVSSTGLTLFVVPVLYRAVEHVTSRTPRVVA